MTNDGVNTKNSPRHTSSGSPPRPIACSHAGGLGSDCTVCERHTTSASGLGQVTCISSEHGWFPHRYVVAATSLSAMSTAFLAKLDCTCLGREEGGQWVRSGQKNNTE